MNGDLSDEAVELEAVVRDRIETAGGVDVLRSAVGDPAERERAGRMLDELGLWDLGPLDGPVELEAAAAACRAAGSFAFPYPIAERLASGHSDAAVTLVSRTAPRVTMHLDLPFAWRGLDLAGVGYRVAASGSLLGTQAAPFGLPTTAEPDGSADVRGAAVLVTLQAWWLLGLVERAVSDTVRYAGEREQFGRPLTAFQAVGFRLADMTLATRSFEELGKYALWSIARGDDVEAGLVDALALRVAALEAADVVLRGAHQVHGAMGFTDEVVVSWLSRASQSVRRLPEDRSATLAVLTECMGRAGLGETGRPIATPPTVAGLAPGHPSGGSSVI